MALTALLLAACAEDGPPAKEEYRLRGELVFTDAVPGAKIEIFDGKTVLATTKTFDRGTFSADVELSSPKVVLRFEAQACLDADKPSSCATLSATAPANTFPAALKLNLRSTLAERLMARSDLTRAAAEKRVSRYLKIPAELTSQDFVALDVFDPWVLADEQYALADAFERSLEAQFDALADHLAEHSDARQSYASTSVSLNPIAKTVGMELAKGALGKIGGEATGQVLSLLGMGDEALAEERHAEIMAQFEQLGGQMRALTEQVERLQTSVNSVLRKIESLNLAVMTVLQKQRAQALLTQTTALSEYIQQVKSISVDLEHAPQLSPKLWRSERNRLQRAIENLVAKRSLISAALLGEGGSPSMIASLIDVEFPMPLEPDGRRQFLSYEKLESIRNFVMFYDEVNTKAYYLFFEYLNFVDTENEVDQKECPDKLPSSGASTQCRWWHELLKARTEYLALAPQEQLPDANMFLDIPVAYKKTDLPSVIYDVGKVLAGPLDEGGLNSQSPVSARLERLVYTKRSAEVADEIRTLADWKNLDRSSSWSQFFFMPMRVAGGVSMSDVAIASGAPKAAFGAGEADAFHWLPQPNGSWILPSTRTALITTGTHGRYLVHGKLKSMAQVDKYLGKAITRRFH